LLIFLTDSEPVISFADATSQQVEPLTAALASRDLNASVQAYHDIVLKAAIAFEQEWTERIDFSMACAFSKNEHLLVVLHAAAADLLFESLAWFRYYHPADVTGVDATNTVAQHAADALCPTQDDFHKALQLHWFKNDLWQALKRLLDSVAAQAVHIRTILYHCLSAP
jgi:hypothetical protein